MLEYKFKEGQKTLKPIKFKLGFDAIIADEAHAYKNIGINNKLVEFGAGKGFSINKREVEGGAEEASFNSARSYDFRFKAKYVTENNKGNNVFLLTATPTPNKIMETFTMLRHLDDKILEEYGILNDIDFANMFLRVGTAINTEKKTGNENIVTAIINAPILRSILDRYVDKLPMEKMPWIELPKANYVTHYFGPSHFMTKVLEDLDRRRKNLSSRPTKGDDNVVSIYTTGRNASIDPRLYGGDHAGIQIQGRTKNAKTDKIQACLNDVATVYKNNKNAGQIIFLDNAGHNILPVNIHQEIKQELCKLGFKPEQIAIISGQETTNPKTGKEIKASGTKLNELKQNIVDAYNKGEIKIIIGTTKSAGEGMDIQVKTTDIHLLDIPQTPAEIIQRIGRGVRYGNENSTVNIHNYIMNGTFDQMSLLVISLAFLITLIFLLMMIEPFPFDKIVFEAVSAFGTVGLSMGITTLLS